MCTYHCWDPRYLRTPGVKIGHELQQFELPTSKNRIAVATSETYHSTNAGQFTLGANSATPSCCTTLVPSPNCPASSNKGSPRDSHTDAQWHHRKPQSLRLQRPLQWRPASSVQMHHQETTSDAPLADLPVCQPTPSTSTTHDETSPSSGETCGATSASRYDRQRSTPRSRARTGVTRLRPPWTRPGKRDSPRAWRRRKPTSWTR